MKKAFYLVFAACLLAAVSNAQPRPTDKTATKPTTPVPAPTSVTVKYEGGMFGFNDKMTGTLKFDDVNSRMVFFGENQKELFGIPYDALLVIYPQSKAVTSTAGNVIKWIPLPGAGLAGFIKEKRRYLVAQFDDPDVDARGTVNFKFENKAILDAVIKSLASRAGLQPRGDAFYKPKTVKKGS